MPPARRSSTRSKVSWTLLVLVSRLNPLYPTTRPATSGRRRPPSAPQLSPLFPQNTPADPVLAPAPASPLSLNQQSADLASSQSTSPAPAAMQMESGGAGSKRKHTLSNTEAGAGEAAPREGSSINKNARVRKVCGGVRLGDSRAGIVTQPLKCGGVTTRRTCLKGIHSLSMPTIHPFIGKACLPGTSPTRTRPLRISRYICTGSCL